MNNRLFVVTDSKSATQAINLIHFSNPFSEKLTFQKKAQPCAGFPVLLVYQDMKELTSLQRQQLLRVSDSGGSRGPNNVNRNIVRQIAKFGIIVYCKIIINI